jgi:hypothetical protein
MVEKDGSEVVESDRDVVDLCGIYSVLLVVVSAIAFLAEE